MTTREPDPAPSPPASPRRGRGFGLVCQGVVALAVTLVGLEGYSTGALGGLLFQILLGLGVLTVGVRIVAGFRRNLELGLIRTPTAPRLRPYWLQALNRTLLWGLTGFTLHLSLPAALFSPGDRVVVAWLLWGLVATLILCELIPRKTLHLIPNLAMLGFSLFLIGEIGRVLSPGAGAVLLDPPFRGEWGVFNGGRSALVNHHYALRAQRHALDLDRAASGPPLEQDAKRLEAYQAFNQPLLAPADGEVVAAEGGLRDNPIGETDLRNPVGNHVVIRIGADRFVLLAHLKQGSLRVRVGDQVRAGQELGRCGNSGNTSEPHLHLQVQSEPGFHSSTLRTFPMRLRGARVLRGGRPVAGEPEPRRNDLILAGEAP